MPSKIKGAKRRRRKKVFKADPAKKKEYREHELHRHLTRYADYDPRTFLDTDLAKDGLRWFQVKVNGHTCCDVRLDWTGIQAALASLTLDMQRISRRVVTPEETARAIKTTQTYSLLYILENFPVRFDSSATRLCMEGIVAFIRRKSGRGGWAREMVETMLAVEETTIKNRLDIREGPSAIFQHRSQYEAALATAIDDTLIERDPLTQANVARQLARRLDEMTMIEGEMDAAKIDDRVIRRWNKQFGVNWKEFLKSHQDRTISS